MVLDSLLSVDSLSSACVKSLELADMRFILSVPLYDCQRAATILKIEASHIT